MALKGPRQEAEASVALIQNPSRESSYGEMEYELESHEELEKLELDIKEMADKILHYRCTLPDQLKEAFALLASDMRPESGWNGPESRPGISGYVVRQGNSSSPDSRVSGLSKLDNIWLLFR